MPVSAPADRRFRRAQVRPTRKRSWRQRWPLLVRLILAMAVGLGGMVWAAGRVRAADALTIGHISITGNTRMSRGEVLSLLDGLRGASLLSVDLDTWRDRLLTSPWVADAVIRRRFPGGVVVHIAERQPLGIGRIGESLYLLDRRGAIIDEFGPNYAELDLPIIDGIAAPGSAGQPDESRAGLAGRLLADLRDRPDLARRVSQVDVSDVRDAVVVLDGDAALVRLGTERFAERLQSYLDLMPALRERVPDIDSVDLRFDERVYVRPHGRHSGS